MDFSSRGENNHLIFCFIHITEWQAAIALNNEISRKLLKKKNKEVKFRKANHDQPKNRN